MRAGVLRCKSAFIINDKGFHLDVGTLCFRKRKTIQIVILLPLNL